jgi:hypothetical protein
MGESAALSPILAPKTDDCSTCTPKCLRKKVLLIPRDFFGRRHLVGDSESQPPGQPPRIENDVNKGLTKLAERVGLNPIEEA